MKKFIVIPILLASLVSLPSMLSVEASEPTYSYIVKLDGKDPVEVANDLNMSLVDELPAIDSILVESSEPFFVSSSIANSYSINPLPQEPTFFAASQQVSTGFTDLRLSLPHSFSLKGDGVKIAVLDSGVNVNHPDLKLAGSVSMIEGSSATVDSSGHGTHVAGIIGATDNTFGVLGAVPNAQLYSVKVLEGSFGLLGNVIRGIQWSIDNDIDIINMSITTYQPDPSFEAILKEAERQGILIVAASGNIAANTLAVPDVLYPARYSSVIAVGATNRTQSLASFSYKGPSLEVVAPGEQILSTYVSQVTKHHDDYSLNTGTSMATPFVTSILAQYKQAFPHLTNTQLRNALRAQALDMGVKGFDTSFGHGLVQPIQQKPFLFFDLNESMWYKESISYLFDKNVIKGFEDGTYRPFQPIRRADAVLLIGRALNWQPQEPSMRFSDVPSSHYAARMIETAYRNGAIDGFPNGTFQPNDYIKRGDMAVIIERIFELSESTDHPFVDVSPNRYYASPINAVYGAGIIQGYKGNVEFKPEQFINRAENAEVLAKALKYSIK